MNDKHKNNPSLGSENSEEKNPKKSTPSHPVATGLGAAGGGAVGAAIGDSVGGKVGVAVGGVAGAIAGGIVGNKVAGIAQEALKEVQPSLGVGANNKPVELLRHYSWEELRALSKPQKNNFGNAS
jgi:hypothetical protein